MKSIKLFSALCALLAVVAACEQPYDGPDNPAEGGIRLSVTMESSSTKVNVDDGTGFCRWSTSSAPELRDSIAVWLSGTSQNGVVSDQYVDADVSVNSEGNPGTTDASTGGVTLNIDGTLRRANFAVFPSTSAVKEYSSSSDLRVVYPTTYDLSSRTTDELRDYARMPMVASNDPVKNDNLKFYHVGGLLRITLPNSEIAGATQVKVTFLGMEHVTGTYKIDGIVDGEVSGLTHTASTPVAGTGNEVTFKLPSVGSSGNTCINVPLPWGDYSKMKGVQVDVSIGGVEKRQIKSGTWHHIARRQGKKMDFNFADPGSLWSIDIPVDERVTLWKGERIGVSASAFDNTGTLIPNADITWSVEPSTGVAEIVGGELVAVGAGEALVKAASTQNPEKFDNFIVYVNEATITLSPGELTGRAGKTGKITADVTYTRNGDWSVPRISWSTTAPSYVTVAEASLLPDESNVVNFLAINGSSPASVKAEIIVVGNSGNPVTVAGAECVVDIKSGAYVPGKFTVNEDGKQVYFASGNLVVKNTYNGTSNVRKWMFEENQWDVHYDISSTNGYSETGVDHYISHFGWATAAVKNPKGDYGYDQRHIYFYPHQTNYFDSENEQYDEYYDQYMFFGLDRYNFHGYGPSSNPNGWGFVDPENMSMTAEMRMPFDHAGSVDGAWTTITVKENTWNYDPEVKQYCEWGLHFNEDGSENTDTPLAGTWYTLSSYEWMYLFGSRPEAELLCGFGTIYDSDTKKFFRGLIILPDNWENPEDCTFLPICSDYGFNLYFAGSGDDRALAFSGRWADMEASGAVFLPLTGLRSDNNSGNATVFVFENRYGNYWSSSSQNFDMDGQSGSYVAISMFFSTSSTPPKSTMMLEKSSGLAVRLVHDVHD